jgi:hypothetical protein
MEVIAEGRSKGHRVAARTAQKIFAYSTMLQ